MKPKRGSQRSLRALAAEHGAEDGLDPRDFFRGEKYPRKPARKTMQLCGQVADALNQILGGECGDDVLRSLHVVSVTPCSDASQLLVLFSSDVADAATTPIEILTRLTHASGLLRSLVAEVVTRRRAPKLVFRVVAAEEDVR